MHPQYDNQGIHNFLLKCYTIIVNTQVQRLAFSLEKLRKMYKILIISYNGILYDIPYDIKNFYTLWNIKILQHSVRKLTIYITNSLFR